VNGTLPFRDEDEVSALGLCGYLWFAARANERWGSLLLTNARGRALWLLTNRAVLAPDTAQAAAMERKARAMLLGSLLNSSPSTADLLLLEMQSPDVMPEVWPSCIPAVSVGSESGPGYSWLGLQIPPRDKALVLWEWVCSHGLLREPFARTERALEIIMAAGIPDPGLRG